MDETIFLKNQHYCVIVFLLPILKMSKHCKRKCEFLNTSKATKYRLLQNLKRQEIVEASSSSSDDDGEGSYTDKSSQRSSSNFGNDDTDYESAAEEVEAFDHGQNFRKHISKMTY